MRSLLRLAIATLAALSVAQTVAQSFPVKPVTLVVPANAGGPTDTLARALQVPLGERLKQPIVVENRAGSGGMVGMTQVLQAPADGYTLLLASSSALNSATLIDKAPVHPRDATFIAAVGQTAYALVVPAASPVKSAAELLSTKDKKLVIASWEQGSQAFVNAHTLAALMPRGTAVLQLRSGDWLAALLGGQAAAGIFPLPTVSDQVVAGKLRALAVTGPNRTASLPNVPTTAEAGLKGDFVGDWYVVLAPKGIPPASAKVLSDAVSDAVRKVQPKLAERGIAPLDLDPRGFATFVDQTLVQSVGGGGTPRCTNGKCYCSATRQCKTPPCENC